MAINLQNVNVLPPNVPSNRGRIASNPSFGFSEPDAWDEAEKFREQQYAMEELAADKSNPLAKVAKIMAVLGGVAVTAITTKVTLDASFKTIKNSATFGKYFNNKTGIFAKTKQVFIENAKTIKASRVAKRIVENAQLLKAKIKSTSVGAWMFKKLDAFNKDQTVISSKEFVKNLFKNIFSSSKNNATTAVGGIAGAGVLAKEVTTSSRGDD